jgi:hypothetical protein
LGVFETTNRFMKRLHRVGLAAILALGGPWLVAACSGEDNSGASGTAGSANSGAGASAGSGAGNSGVGGTGATAGSAASAGTAGSSATSGSGGSPDGGSGGSVGVPPSDLTLTAYGANTTVGLEWPVVQGATAYKIYWSTSPGVTPASGQVIDVTEPAYVQRGLTNGTTYYYVISAVTASGETAPSAETSAMPSGEWVLEELGTGVFDSVISDVPVSRVPIAQRLHVVLFPEGYTAADMNVFRGDPAGGGDRTNDVDRWVDLVFGIEPYSLFREAFVVWFLPRASATRIDGGDTAFRVPVTNSGGWATGSISSNGETAARAWAALELHPYAPTDFSSGSGGLGNVRHFTAAFLILDPERNRAGLSGRALGLQNPADGSARLGSAFGVGHAHEFTHAFAGVRDEYMEQDFIGRTWSTSPTTNVVGSNACGELPWAHLLQGAGINTTANLVGAFGTTEVGVHSELLCLMNGTHDNGLYYARDDAGSCSESSCTLRVEDRMCNHCREITAYRVFQRSALLDEHDVWAQNYRTAFYERYGFKVPAVVPQSNDRNDPEDGTAVYEGCVATAQSREIQSSETSPAPATPYYEGCVLVE